MNLKDRSDLILSFDLFTLAGRYMDDNWRSQAEMLFEASERLKELHYYKEAHGKRKPHICEHSGHECGREHDRP